MPNYSGEPWSDDPNAPKVSKRLHLSEKGDLVGVFTSALLYGIIAVIFFRCMNALLDPTGRKQRGIRWPLVIHTVAMFSFATVSIVTDFYIHIGDLIDNRDFPGNDESPPGPFGYFLDNSDAVYLLPLVPLVLNGLFGDGLLLYRCHVIYAMNKWVIALPCSIYIASFGMGIVFLFQNLQPSDSYWSTSAPSFGLFYISISCSLNVLLTSMIVIRLVINNRIIRNAVGASSTIYGLSGFVNTMLIESCALFTVCSLLYIGSWIVQSYLTNYFQPAFTATQVIGPFLITLRVAKRAALTGDFTTTICSSARFKSQGESTGFDEIPLAPSPGGFVDGREENTGEVGAGAQNSVEERPL